MSRITKANPSEYSSYSLTDEAKSSNWTIQDFIDYIGKLENKLDKIDNQIFKTGNHLSTIKDIIKE